MSAISIQQMADRVAALMRDKLGARGTGLEAALKSRGGALPRKVRRAADDLAAAATMAQNPKLLLQVDHGALAQNYDLCQRHLSGMKARAGWRSGLVTVAASIALSVLMVTVLVIVLLRWRGLV